MNFTSQVPQKPNFVDCGAYCIYFFKRFIKDPSGICQVLHVSVTILRLGKVHLIMISSV
jgi:Ulp1 family protease